MSLEFGIWFTVHYPEYRSNTVFWCFALNAQNKKEKCFFFCWIYEANFYVSANRNYYVVSNLPHFSGNDFMVSVSGNLFTFKYCYFHAFVEQVEK